MNGGNPQYGYKAAQKLYLDAGWKAPLPLPARAKYPPPDGTTGRGAPDPSPAQLEAWRNGHFPDGNLALRLPEDVLGIDVDDYGDKPGAATLATLEATLGPLPPTAVSSSRPMPSGIRFYRVPAGRAWRNPGGGIDIIHHGHRYAVVWPSIHPEGRPYLWTVDGLGPPLRMPGVGLVPQASGLPDLPPSWVAYLDAGEARPYVEGEATASWLSSPACWPDGPWGTPCPVMVESRDRHIGAVYTGGSRHDAMNAGIAALVHLAGAGHRGGLAAIQALRAAFEQAVVDRSTWGEFDRSLEGALRKEGLSELFASPPCGCGRPPDAVVTPATPATVAEGLYLSITELANLPKPSSLIEGVLDGGSLFAITGRDGVYKSFVAFDWLACLGTGKPWLGRAVTRSRVLYVVGEGVHGTPARAAAWQQAHSTTIGDDVLTVRVEPVNLFKGGPAFDELVVRVVQGGYRVVVFDTLQRMASGGDLNSSKDASVVIERLDMLRRAAPGGAVGFVAHTGKSDLDIRGSSVLEDDVDIVWRLKRDEDEQVATLSMHKRKDGPPTSEILLAPQLVTGTGSIVLGQTTRQAVQREGGRGSKHAMLALEILTMRVNEDGLSMSKLGEQMRNRGAAKGTSTPENTVNWLLEKGYISINKKPGYNSHEITEAGRAALAKASSTNR